MHISYTYTQRISQQEMHTKNADKNAAGTADKTATKNAHKNTENSPEITRYQQRKTY